MRFKDTKSTKSFISHKYQGRKGRRGRHVDRMPMLDVCPLESPKEDVGIVITLNISKPTTREIKGRMRRKRMILLWVWKIFLRVLYGCHCCDTRTYPYHNAWLIDLEASFHMSFNQEWSLVWKKYGGKLYINDYSHISVVGHGRVLAKLS